MKIARKFDAKTGQIEDRELGVFSSYDFSYVDLITENYIPLTTLMFSRKVLLASGGFDEEFELYEDWDLLLRIAEQYPPSHISKVTVKYIFWDEESQISQRASDRKKYYDKIFRKHREKFDTGVILHLKEKRDIVEGEFRKSLEQYRELEQGYKDYIDVSEKKIRNAEEKIQDAEKKIINLGDELEHQKVHNKVLQDIIASLEGTKKFLEEKVDLLEREIHLMVNTIGWRLLTRLRRVRDRFIPSGSFRKRAYEKIISPLKYKGFFMTLKHPDNEYSRWIASQEPDIEALGSQSKESLHFSLRPEISIIVPVYNTDRNMLISMLNSVLSQTYDNWELCVVDGNSDSPDVKDILSEYSKKDKRINVSFLEKNYGIAGNSNRALQMATGEFITFLDHDDELAPFALFEVVKILNRLPEIDIIYSDEDKIHASGKRCKPFFKPDWSPDLLMSVNYVCHLMVIRKDVLDSIGGFREGYDGAQDYDLVLRCVSKTSRIVHVPKVLYHWRMHSESTAQNIYAKDYAHESGKKALGEYLSESNINAHVEDGAGITNYRVRYLLSSKPKVSVIIPFRDKYKVLEKCIESIIQKSSYKDYELILISNSSTEKKLFDYLDRIKSLPQVKIAYYNHPFNYSAINNFGVKQSDGEVLLFLNNDTEVITGDWLESMLEHAMRREIGSVGCKLLFPDNTIQHAGVVIGLTGFAGHIFSRMPDDAYTHYGSVDFVRNYLAVTGACMMMRRDVFEEVKGFDERFALCGSDVEICLRLIQNGYRVVYTPFAKLYHHEALTRGGDIPAQDFQLSWNVYEKYIIGGDPYYNPNLTRLKTDCSLKTDGEEGALKEIREHALGQG
jgi:GT2 family glycosyltransferase